MEEEWFSDLNKELDSHLEIELILMEMKHLSQELGMELKQVLEGATDILRSLNKEKPTY